MFCWIKTSYFLREELQQDLCEKSIKQLKKVRSFEEEKELIKQAMEYKEPEIDDIEELDEEAEQDTEEEDEENS